MSNQPEPILDLEALVPTRETCERLRDRGFDYLTRFYWIEDRVFFEKKARQPLYKEARLPAPTAAELGEMLPDRIVLECHDGRVHPFWLQTQAEGHPKWGAFYVTKESQNVRAPVFRHRDLQTGAKTEAEARARLWLRLESEGLLPDGND